MQLPTPLPKGYIADHVELYFKDQYLCVFNIRFVPVAYQESPHVIRGRADMHRISLALTDTCVYVGQRIQLAGLNLRATVGGVWVAGKKVEFGITAA